MNKKTFLGGIKKCANPHVLRAIPHTQHNGILLLKLLRCYFLDLSKNFNSASSISKNKISKVAIKARNKYYLSSNRNHLLEDFVIQPIFATEKENNN